ncbi:MAG: DNA repair protein RecO, partial [Saprospiraceae bacterium]
MLIKTRGIVFRVVKYGETSVITEVYTEEKGLQSYIIHGVRTKKPKFHSGLIQNMSLIEMVVYAQEGKVLHHVKELRSAHPYQAIPFQIIKSAVGSFMLELAQKSIKESEANPELFNFLFDIFVFLDETTHPVVNTHLSFMVKLAAYLGIMPEIEKPRTNQYFDIRSGTFSEQHPM